MTEQKGRSLRRVTEAGLTAGLYVALCLMITVSAGPLQFRVAEALTVLPVFTPAAVPGLTVGCLLANLLTGSPAGAWDWLVGPLTTLVAALLTRWLARRAPLWVATLPPVVLNAPVLGAEYALLGGNGFSWPLFWMYTGQIAVSQLVACTLCGLWLARGVRRMTRILNAEGGKEI